jgi:hypothetical protein
VLVPVANPIGLAQRVDHKPMGRFELDTPRTSTATTRTWPKRGVPAMQDKLGADAASNVAAVRRHATYLAAWQPHTELQSLRKTLLGLP